MRAIFLLGLALQLGSVWAQAPKDPDLAAFEAAAAADRGEQNADTAIVAIPLNSGVSFFDNSMNPAISFIMDMALFHHSAEEHRHHGGHTSNHTGPFLQAVEMAATGNIDPFFIFDLKFSLSHGHLEDAVIQTTSLPANLQLRIGQFRTRLGRRNTQCLHQWNFVDHSLALDYLFSNEGLSLPGAEISVLLPLPWYTELILGVQGSGVGRSQSATNIQGFEDLIYSPRLKQFFDLSEDLGLLLGLNASLARSPFPDPQTSNRSWIYGGDLSFKWRPIGEGASGHFFFNWTNEYWYRELEVPGDLWRDHGGYSELQWSLTQEWQTALRGELWRRLEGEAGESRDRLGTDSLRGEWSISYTPSHFSRLRLQYGLEEIDGYQRNHMTILQLEVSAGAHGAHSY